MTSEVNSSAFQLLVMELVPMAIRINDQLDHHQTEFDQTRIDTPLSKFPNDLPGTAVIHDAEVTDDVAVRIENHGFNVGLRLSEVLAFKTSSRILDVLDVMKFVCRDVWPCMYNKQMDNLRTNHRGTFVLIDNNYKLTENMASDKGSADTINKCRNYLWFPCGVIRGILVSYGIEALVSAELSQLSAVTFNIQTMINN